MFAILTTGSRPVAIVTVVLTDMPSLYLQATDFCHFRLRGTTGRPASGTGAQEKTVVPLTSPSPWSVPSRLPLTPSFSYLAPACFFSSICSLIPLFQSYSVCSLPSPIISSSIPVAHAAELCTLSTTSESRLRPLVLQQRRCQR